MRIININRFAIVALLMCSTAAFAADRVRVACVGDSITAGVGAKDRRTQTYPAQLSVLLGDKYDVRNFGVSGIKMTNYKNHKNYAKAKSFEPHIVIIKLGTNDTKTRKFGSDDNKKAFATSYTAAAEELIKTFQSLKSQPKVYLCTPVPVFRDRWGINERSVVEDVNPLVAELSKTMKLPTIDLYKALTGKGKMVPDGVHPNEHGYKIMAETIADSLTHSR